MQNEPSLDEVLRELISLCKEFAQGKYQKTEDLFELTKKGAYPDLIPELAESFGMMVVQIEAREFRLEQIIEDLEKTKADLEIARQKLAQENIRLKSEVRQLRIGIDHTKKAKEVAKITDTDYFKDLRKRAEKIKGSRK